MTKRIIYYFLVFNPAANKPIGVTEISVTGTYAQCQEARARIESKLRSKFKLPIWWISPSCESKEVKNHDIDTNKNQNRQ